MVPYFKKKKIEVLKLPKSFKNLSTSICEHGFQAIIQRCSHVMQPDPEEQAGLENIGKAIDSPFDPVSACLD
jgi:hypothetical protein